MDVAWPVIGADTGWAAFLVLAFLVVRAVVKGDLVPRSTHEREVTAAQHDAQEWRTEGRIKDQILGETIGQVKVTTEETARSLHHYLADLQQVLPVERRRRNGGQT